MFYFSARNIAIGMAIMYSASIAVADSARAVSLMPRWEPGKSYKYITEVVNSSRTAYPGEHAPSESNVKISFGITKHVTAGDAEYLRNIVVEHTYVQFDSQVNGQRQGFDSRLNNAGEESDAFVALKKLTGLQVAMQLDLRSNIMVVVNQSEFQEQFKDCAPCLQAASNSGMPDIYGQAGQEDMIPGHSWVASFAAPSMGDPASKPIMIKCTFKGWVEFQGKPHALVTYFADDVVKSMLGTELTQAPVQLAVDEEAFNGRYLFDPELGVVVRDTYKIRISTTMDLPALGGNATTLMEMQNETRLVEIE